MKIKRHTFVCIINVMGFPVLETNHLYIEIGPRFNKTSLYGFAHYFETSPRLRLWNMTVQSAW